MKVWYERDKLHAVADRGDLDEVRRLVGQGFPLNAFDELSMNPLHYAAKGDHIEIARFLLSEGAEVNAHETEKIGETPLGEVAGTCSYEIAELLVEAGADPTIPGWMQLTALHRAEKRKRPEGRRVYELLQSITQQKLTRSGEIDPLFG